VPPPRGQRTGNELYIHNLAMILDRSHASNVVAREVEAGQYSLTLG